MGFDLEDAIAVLERTPAALDALLRNLPEAWTRQNEGGKTWSPFDVVGHLIHGELTDWMPRLRIILEEGEARAFEPFDRFAQFEANRGKSLGELLDRFRQLRRENLAALRTLRLAPEDFARRGRHPGLGTVTLGELVATWVVHDLDHLHQISRVMASQYREAVGPWAAYVNVLRCMPSS